MPHKAGEGTGGGSWRSGRPRGHTVVLKWVSGGFDGTKTVPPKPRETPRNRPKPTVHRGRSRPRLVGFGELNRKPAFEVDFGNGRDQRTAGERARQPDSAPPDQEGCVSLRLGATVSFDTTTSLRRAPHRLPATQPPSAPKPQIGKLPWRCRATARIHALCSRCRANPGPSPLGAAFQCAQRVVYENMSGMVSWDRVRERD